MKRMSAAILAILSLTLLLGAGTNKRTRSVERPFASGGRVNLRLSSGDYTIRAGKSDSITVFVESSRSIEMDRAVRIETTSTSANVRTDGPKRDTNFIIEVPQRTDIYLRMYAGEVKVQGIEGNKDISLTAGDVDIDTDPAHYSQIRASVTFGDLDAHRLRISKSGIARSFDWTGQGKYYLKAHLFAGDLKLGTGR